MAAQLRRSRIQVGAKVQLRSHWSESAAENAAGPSITPLRLPKARTHRALHSSLAWR